jgi:hypothetical protein
LETFGPPRELVANPRYSRDRQAVLETLDLAAIDPPIVRLVERFAALGECFTLQCCYGHFLYAPGQDQRNLERLPQDFKGLVTYRIAYVAFCLENSPRGRLLRNSLELVSSLDPDYVQFGSPDWFRNQYRNAYALQVEPLRFMDKDEACFEHSEALHVEHIRDLFFTRLNELLEKHLSETRRD